MEREAGVNTVVLIHGLWMTPLSWDTLGRSLPATRSAGDRAWLPGD